MDNQTKTCTKCKKEFPATSEYFHRHSGRKDGLNEICKECSSELYKMYRMTHVLELKLKAAEYHLNNQDRLNKQMRSKSEQIKAEVIAYYGGKCAICGVTHLAFLNIDHISNNGNKHRCVMGRGNRIYRLLKKNGFPPGYQVLCWNHNWLKHLNTIGMNHKESGKAKRNYRHNMKILVISYYGGRCACCGCTDIRVLTIDHINGGGNEHRRIMGYGSDTCSWLRKNGFPSGYQVLCLNCNSGRQVNGGICPHYRIDR